MTIRSCVLRILLARQVEYVGLIYDICKMNVHQLFSPKGGTHTILLVNMPDKLCES